MEKKSNYIYKVELASDVREMRRVYGDSSRQNMEVQRNNRKGIFKPTLNLRNKTVTIPEGKKTDCEHGEFIASKICKAVGIPCCDVDIIKKFIVNPRSRSGKGNIVPGVISYIDLEPGESLINATQILSWYKYEHFDEYKKIIDPLGKAEKNDFSYRMSINNDEHYNNIELIIPAFMAYITEHCGGSMKRAEDVRQSIIDMCMFDCRCANRDRHDENYGLAVGKKGGRFYPLYDNEYILGFSEQTADIGKYSATALQEHINKDLYSVIGVSSKPTKITPSSLITYLFSAYPVETQKAYEKVMKFTVTDLQNLMNECEDLPEEHKAYALRIFRLRTKEIEGIQEEYIDEKGQPIKQTYLPGNKAMELTKGQSGSRSRSKKDKDPITR